MSIDLSNFPKSKNVVDLTSLNVYDQVIQNAFDKYIAPHLDKAVEENLTPELKQELTMLYIGQADVPGMGRDDNATLREVVDSHRIQEIVDPVFESYENSENYTQDTAEFRNIVTSLAPQYRTELEKINKSIEEYLDDSTREEQITDILNQRIESITTKYMQKHGLVSESYEKIDTLEPDGTSPLPDIDKEIDAARSQIKSDGMAVSDISRAVRFNEELWRDENITNPQVVVFRGSLPVNMEIEGEIYGEIIQATVYNSTNNTIYYNLDQETAIATESMRAIAVSHEFGHAIDVQKGGLQVPTINLEHSADYRAGYTVAQMGAPSRKEMKQIALGMSTWGDDVITADRFGIDHQVEYDHGIADSRVYCLCMGMTSVNPQEEIPKILNGSIGGAQDLRFFEWAAAQVPAQEKHQEEKHLNEATIGDYASFVSRSQISDSPEEIRTEFKERLASHGIVVDEEAGTLTIPVNVPSSESSDHHITYDLTDEELRQILPSAASPAEIQESARTIEKITSGDISYPMSYSMFASSEEDISRRTTVQGEAKAIAEEVMDDPILSAAIIDDYERGLTPDDYAEMFSGQQEQDNVEAITSQEKVTQSKTITDIDVNKLLQEEFNKEISVIEEQQQTQQRGM